MKIFNMALCAGRHPIPDAVDGAIFDQEINLSQAGITDALEAEAYDRLCAAGEGDSISLNLYVTGLTVALVAVINVCHKQGWSLTLWHYNRDTDGYFSQVVV